MSMEIIPDIFFLPFPFLLDALIHSQNHLYANDYQIDISNPLVPLKFQIGMPYCLIYIYYECLRYLKFDKSKTQLLICISLHPQTSSSPNFL